MLKKGIDVAQWQGHIDWQKVNADGCEFAILKVINKSRAIENSFERNYQGVQAVGIPYGVYNYSYATSVESAVRDAQAVVNILKTRKAPEHGVWLDVEDSCQKGLKGKLADIITAYGSTIMSGGYSFGVYTGLSFFNTYIKPYLSRIPGSTPFWIARYPSAGNHTLQTTPPINKRPDIPVPLWAWQWSSTGKVAGIKGNVDLNEMYMDAYAYGAGHDEYEDKKSNQEIAAEVINGKWSIGDERKRLLTAAGYDFLEIQAIVNQIVKG